MKRGLSAELTGGFSPGCWPVKEPPGMPLGHAVPLFKGGRGRTAGDCTGRGRRGEGRGPEKGANGEEIGRFDSLIVKNLKTAKNYTILQKYSQIQ